MNNLMDWSATELAAHDLLSRLLLSLSQGSCPASLWQAAAVNHYHAAELESCRRELVRVSLAAGIWDWSAVPQALADFAATQLAALQRHDG